MHAVAWLVAGGWYRPHSSAVTQIVALASLWGIYGEELGEGERSGEGRMRVGGNYAELSK